MVFLSLSECFKHTDQINEGLTETEYAESVYAKPYLKDDGAGYEVHMVVCQDKLAGGITPEITKSDLSIALRKQFGECKPAFIAYYSFEHPLFKRGPSDYSKMIIG